MLDAGEYQGDVVAQKLYLNDKGNPQLDLVCRVQGTIDANGNEVMRTIYMPMTDKSVEYVAKDIERAFGFVPEKWSHLNPEKTDHISLVGYTIPLYCQHGEWQGKVSEKWRISNPDLKASFEKPPLEPNKLLEMDAMFGAALAGKKKPTKAMAPAPAATAPKGNDDIPF